jgi:hypothetical protein
VLAFWIVGDKALDRPACLRIAANGAAVQVQDQPGGVLFRERFLLLYALPVRLRGLARLCSTRAFDNDRLLRGLLLATDDLPA